MKFYKDSNIFAEKLSNGKTVEKDRRNDRNWLILVLKDNWHYEIIKKER